MVNATNYFDGNIPFAGIANVPHHYFNPSALPSASPPVREIESREIESRKIERVWHVFRQRRHLLRHLLRISRALSLPLKLTLSPDTSMRYDVPKADYDRYNETGQLLLATLLIVG